MGIESLEPRRNDRPRLTSVRRTEDGGRGSETYSYVHDAEGRLIREEQVLGTAGRIVREYTYDDRGRLTRRYQLIEFNRHPTYWDPEPGTSTHEGNFEYVYDGDVEQPVMASYGKDGSTLWIAEHAYDANGKLVQERTTSFYSGEPEVRTEEYTYDDAGRKVERREVDQHGSGTWYRSTYDQQGRLVREDRGSIGAEHPFGTVEYEYDGRTTVARNTYGDELVWVQRKTTDEHGNVVTFTHENYRGGKRVDARTTRYENAYAS